MRRGTTAIGTVMALALAATPAAAMPAGKNVRPKVVSAKAEHGDARAVTVDIVGRDRDDVVRGVEIEWGEGQPAQGLSSCERASRRGRGDRRRRGKKADFELSYAYPAAGRYTITVRVLSGGCGKRPQQRSKARTIRVHVD